MRRLGDAPGCPGDLVPGDTWALGGVGCRRMVVGPRPDQRAEPASTRSIPVKHTLWLNCGQGWMTSKVTWTRAPVSHPSTTLPFNTALRVKLARDIAAGGADERRKSQVWIDPLGELSSTGALLLACTWAPAAAVTLEGAVGPPAGLHAFCSLTRKPSTNGLRRWMGTAPLMESQPAIVGIRMKRFMEHCRFNAPVSLVIPARGSALSCSVGAATTSHAAGASDPRNNAGFATHTI